MKFPVFIVNAKNYRESSGERLRRFIEYAILTEADTGVKMYIAPSVIDLYYYSREFSSSLISQYVDVVEYGSSTGHIPLKRLIEIGVNRSLLNHSEYKVPHNKIKELASHGSKLNFDFVVCVDSINEMVDLLKSEVYPTAYAIEPPELIGSGKSVSKYKPETVVKAVKLGEEYDIPVLCGAGIVNEEDVKKAVELGVAGILVSSGIIKSKDPLSTMLKMASALKK